jgi:hypothetical protein
MAQRDGEIENLAHAYGVLNARWDASPRQFLLARRGTFPGEARL